MVCVRLITRAVSAAKPAPKTASQVQVRMKAAEGAAHLGPESDGGAAGNASLAQEQQERVGQGLTLKLQKDDGRRLAKAQGTSPFAYPACDSIRPPQRIT